MFGLLKKLFQDDTEALQKALNQGGTILDVRSPMEFKSGSVKGAVNIAHTDIQLMKKKVLKLKQPIIVCCASGMRSTAAIHNLKELGVTDVVNAKTVGRVSRVMGKV